MVLAFKDNQEKAITIEPGESIELIGPDHDDRFVVVRARGEEFLVFESDFSSRAALVSAAVAC
jgi:hypothetical protein